MIKPSRRVSRRWRTRLGRRTARALAAAEAPLARSDRRFGPELVRLREEAHQARADVQEATLERDHLLAQMREANERLVIATVRADEKTDEALAAQGIIAAQVAWLEAQDRAKNEFLAMLGHELRNPLAPIVSTLELMRLRSPDVLVEERALVEDQVQQLARIVDDLLDLARITEGNLELRTEPVELSAIVARAVATVAPIVSRKNQDLHVDVADGLVVDGDFVRLVQIVGNLLSNAAKYTPESGSLVVTGERRGADVVLRVQDNGIGIAAAMLPRVFDLFAQEQRDRSQGGLGLGLAITQRLVRLHAGSITARSEGIGRGTVMEIELPATTLAPRVAAVPVPAPLIARIKILLVDDNLLANMAMRLLLTTRGHDVRSARDGAEALVIAMTFAPDIALLDIGLPVMDGYELARRLRAQLAPHDVRLIALTGYGQPDDRQRSREAGFDEHLVKPVMLEVLEASLARLSARA